MKKSTIILVLLTLLIFTQKSFAQEVGRAFSQISQTYYLHKDKDVVKKAIDFFNNAPMDYNKLSPIAAGFFGALFQIDETVKADFAENVNEITKPEIKQLMISLLSTSIDSLYSKVQISPSLNDMNWSSFFATGNTKYVDKILSNIPYIENRSDINLFLAGATAKWSLCGNSKKNDIVNKHLNSFKDKNIAIKEILENEPKHFSDEIIEILKKQKETGVWN